MKDVSKISHIIITASLPSMLKGRRQSAILTENGPDIQIISTKRTDFQIKRLLLLQ